MDTKKSTSIFVILITLLVMVATTIGISSINLKNEYEFTTIYGEVVEIYGGGIYKMHTVEQVYQVIPHDMAIYFWQYQHSLFLFSLQEKEY